jgi:hypothetical protein
VTAGLIVNIKNAITRRIKKMAVDAPSEYAFNLKTQISDITGKQIDASLGTKITHRNDFNVV